MRVGYYYHMNVIDRPTPVGTTKRGHPKYDPAEVAAYRKARGATQVEVAKVMRVSQGLIATFERVGNPKFDLAEKTIVPILDAIDRIAARHDRLVAEGLAELEAIRSKVSR